MRLLIDGYNLLFQSQEAGRAREPGWLEKARERLLQLLERQLPESELAATQIVFDASRRSQHTQDEIRSSGMVVTYAVDDAEADDLLERLIRQHSHAKQLTVVSSDHRIQRCAKARRATALDAEDFLDRLERANARPQQRLVERSRTAEHETQHSPKPTESEIRFWMEQFFGDQGPSDDRTPDATLPRDSTDTDLPSQGPYDT